MTASTYDSLGGAQASLARAVSDLEAANASGSAVDRMVIATILRDATDVRKRIASMRVALRDDGRNGRT